MTPAGGQDPQKMTKLMLGSSDKLNIYVAPADEHTVVMAYTSIERLKESLEFYKSKQPGLSADAGVAKVAAALPPGSQIVSYANLQGIAELDPTICICDSRGTTGGDTGFSRQPAAGDGCEVFVRRRGGALGCYCGNAAHDRRRGGEGSRCSICSEQLGGRDGRFTCGR